MDKDFLELTCKCIADYSIYDYNFTKNREYQVDVYPLFNCVYYNGGWKDYIFMTQDEFNKYFKIIQ